MSTFNEDAFNQMVANLRLVITPTQAGQSELMKPKDMAREIFNNISRSKMWQITKSPGFPRPIMLGVRTRYYRRREVLAWLAERQQSGGELV
jgi:predicted DNA-binding transcriptional regulator AlpA